MEEQISQIYVYYQYCDVEQDTNFLFIFATNKIDNSTYLIALV